MSTRELSRPTALDSPFPGLVASPPAALPFAPDVAIRAFLLEREHGNVLVYSAGTVPDVADELERLGGVRWQYLNHWHEAMFDVGRVAATFGATVVVHAADAGEVARRAGVESVTFDHAAALGEGFEIVPIPGHTPGATASCSSTATIATCSRGNRSSSHATGGWRRCWGPAPARPTSRASSGSASSTSTCSSRRRRQPAASRSRHRPGRPPITRVHQVRRQDN